MNAKWPVITIVVALVVGAGAFFGGMRYGESRPPSIQAAMETMRNASPEDLAQTFQGGGGLPDGGGGVPGGGGGFPGFGGDGTRRGGAGDGFVNGDIVSADAESITVKLADGSSKIVFFSGSTSISRQAEGTAADLSTGTSVLVTGATNADGSITAESIQIRPAGAPPFGAGAEAPTTTPTT